MAEEAVTFPKGVYHIGQLKLKSGIELHLEDGAIILGSTNPYDYQRVDTKQSAGDERKDNSQLGLIIAKMHIISPLLVWERLMVRDCLWP